MAHSTPLVSDGALLLASGTPIAVDSAAWFAWLAEARLFAFSGRLGRFTARKERASNGRGGWYWRAYRKRGGHLQRTHLGRSERVTLARLEAAAAALTTPPPASARSDADQRPEDTLATRRRSLPRGPTPLVGRAQELATIGRLLPTTRLLTLTGAGGIGKTRLALALAHTWRDPVAWVDLTSIDSAPLVMQALAGAVGARETAERGLLSALLARLATWRGLVVLDNCEHLLLAVAEMVTTLVSACRHLRVLTTSRQPLNLRGEVIWRVPSLSLPAPEDRATARDPVARLAALRRSEAVQLFLDRAGAAVPDLDLTPDNAAAVAQICRRLDGIPLALELAAARARVMGIDQIAARLDDQLGLLRGGPGMPPRHQTLRATVAWSHALLGGAESCLLRRLAVFRGGWTLAAAEAVSALETTTGETLTLLASLVERSLVLFADGEGDGRYHLLAPIQHYAAEQLAISGESDATRQRHAAWYLGLAIRASPAVHGPGQLAWLAQLEAEHDNLRVALAHTLEVEPTTCLDLASRLGQFWQVRGHFTEGRHWLEAALARTGKRDATRAHALLATGLLVGAQGELARGRTLVEAALALSRDLGDPALIARAARELGALHLWLGDDERARGFLEEGLELSRSLGDRHGLSVCLMALGRLAERQADHARAEALIAESQHVLRAVGDRWLISEALRDLGKMARGDGDDRRAEIYFREALAMARELGAWNRAAWLLDLLGRLADARGRFDEARACHEESLALARRQDDRLLIAANLAALARRALRDGDADGAVALARASIDASGSLDHHIGRAEALAVLGRAMLARGDVAAARPALRESLELARDDRDGATLADALEGTAALLHALGRPVAATRLLGAIARQRAPVAMARPDPTASLPEALRAALGEATFARAWRAGQALTGARASAEAMSALTVARARPPTPPRGDGLSRREAEVVALIAAGLSNRAIATHLSLSIRTVERHITNLYGKIGARGRADATVYALTVIGPGGHARAPGEDRARRG